MLIPQEDFIDKLGLKVGDRVKLNNSGYIPEIRGCVGVVISYHPCYFPAEGQSLTFYDIRITEPSPDHNGFHLGGIDYEVSSPEYGLELAEPNTEG